MSELQTITCIDDDPDILMIASLALCEIGGAQVETFNSGKELLNSVDQVSSQLFLMDMMMPEYTGLETLSRLRQNQDIDQTPVIFLTAKAQKHEVEGYLTAGAIGVVEKPFDPMELFQKISDIWNKANASDS